MFVHLIDGTFELFRAHFGAPSALSPDGMEVGASRAFARSLLALLRDDSVTHVACAFDHEIESFRNQLFAGYKTGEGIEPELLAQFPVVERLASALGVVCWPMVEFEADDALATGAIRYARDPRVETVFVCTPDKDLAQVIQGDKIVSLDRIRKTIRNESGVVEKFGVPPSAIADYLALVGDTADGIPGLPRWGAKSSSMVLARYGHIEDIPDSADDWDIKVRGASKLAEILAENRSQALLYRQLATLRLDVPLKETVDDLRWRGANRSALEAVCIEIGEKDLLRRVPQWRE